MAGDTYSRASSTSRARGSGLTTNTLGTFRASGSLGTSFTLCWRKGQIRIQAGALSITSGCQVCVRGGRGQKRKDEDFKS